ncbi:hypothetical protein GJ496_000506 [Pomphorhynchus laevis]|nr:hypothetical protein GJ496_000506 [Pomphorhynchus laevis]
MKVDVNIEEHLPHFANPTLSMTNLDIIVSKNKSGFNTFLFCHRLIKEHKYPKTQIDIRVLVISNLSSTIFSDVVVAAGIALCDAGIEMYDVLTADTIVSI